jgi:Zn-dependent peptidase ImmA (M78 family)
MCLGLDTTNVSLIKPNKKLAGRLKKITKSHVAIDQAVTLELADTAWVIKTQNELQKLLKGKNTLKWNEFNKDGDYGNSINPAWEKGHDLASLTRGKVGLDALSPIKSLLKLCEDVLEVPIVYFNLPNNIAAITVMNRDARGIVLNSTINKNVWIRRIHLAHELEHFLYDNDNELNKIRPDTFDNMNDNFDDDISDTGYYVEQRANAFAVEFLAPKNAVKQFALENNLEYTDITQLLNYFGISFISACRHYWNVFHRQQFDIKEIRASVYEPSEQWQQNEVLNAFDIPFLNIPINRRGHFVKMVVEANSKKLISDDTASMYLSISLDGFKAKKNQLFNLFLIF